MATGAAPTNDTGAEAGGTGGVAPIPADDFDILRQTMEFDPFGPPSTQDAEGSDDGEPQGERQDTPATEPRAKTEPRQPQAAAPEPPPSDAAAAPEGGSDKETLESLRSMVTGLLTREVQGRTQETPPQAQPQVQGQPAPQAHDEPAYRLQFPREIVTALASEDENERHAAVNGMANSIMNRLSGDFREALRAMYMDLLQKMPQAAHQVSEQRSKVQMVQDDFYGNFPELRELEQRLPSARAVIWDTVGKAAKARGVADWSPEFRNEVGNYLIASLGIPRKAQGQAAAPAAAARPKPRAPFAAGSGSQAREAAPSGSSDFMDVLTAGGF